MPNTPHGYPYPVGTDRVMDGDDVIHNLADKIDSQLGVLASGSVTVQTTTVNTPASASVTFPAGRFTTPPNVIVSCQGANPQFAFASTAAPTASGTVLWACKTTGTAATVVYWIATQI